MNIPHAQLRGTHSHAFTLIELLASIAVIAILVAILIPIIGSVRASASSTKCVSNLRLIGAALHSYANDNDDRFPPWYHYDWKACWFWYLESYVGLPEKTMGFNPKPRSAGIFICPSFDPALVKERKAAYAYNEYIMTPEWNFERSVVPEPGKTFLVVEINANTELGGQSGGAGNVVGPLVGRHPGNSANFLFMDGHVETIESASRIQDSDSRWRWW